MPVYLDGTRRGLPAPLRRSGSVDALHMRHWFGAACVTGALATATLPIIGKAYLHKRVIPAYEAVFAEIAGAGRSHLVDKADYGGTYNCRRVRGGSSYSPHSWAVAMDLNVHHLLANGREIVSGRTNYKCKQAEIAPSLAALATYFLKWGFSWGGWWRPQYCDPMHFEATDLTVALLEGKEVANMEVWEERAGKVGAGAGREWQCKVWHDVDDLLGEGIATTWWDHQTSSGIPADTPGMVACALPTGRCDATRGTPFPKLPWRTLVRVYYPPTGKIVYCPLIDEGPAYRAEAGTGKPGGAMIDLTPEAKALLGFADVMVNDRVIMRILPEQVWHPEMAGHYAKLFGERAT